MSILSHNPLNARLRRQVFGISLLLSFGLIGCNSQTSGEVSLEPAKQPIAETEMPSEEIKPTEAEGLKPCPIKVKKECYNSFSLAGAGFRGRVGIVDGDSRKATPDLGKGFLSFGPYATMISGNYQFTLDYKLDATSETPVANRDSFSIIGLVNGETTVLEKGRLSPMETVLTVNATLPSDAQKVQFRVYYNGQSTLSVNQVTIAAKP